MAEPSLPRGRRVPTSAAMLVRFFASLFLVVSLALAPAAMGVGGQAMAAPAAHAPAHGEGHCPDSAPAGDEKAPMHLSCAGCTVLAAVPPAVAEMAAPAHAEPPLRKSLRLTGLAPEAATPPPRSAPNA